MSEKNNIKMYKFLFLWKSKRFCNNLEMVTNEKGVALAMILVLSFISLAIMAGLIYMITLGTKVSGIQKRYDTALEAGKGGAEIIYEIISARGNPGLSLSNFYLDSSLCMTDKLNKSTENWGETCDKSMTVSASSHDMRFDLGGSPYPTYRVYAKIVDTIEGNSGGDEGLLGKGVVASGTGEVTVVHRPYLYTIEIEAENPVSPSERAKLSILYQY